MTNSVSNRRIVAVGLEALGGGTKGTFNPPSVAADAIPSLRDAKISSFQPLRVDRETIRLSLTGVADIYAGQAIAEITVLAEMGGVPPNAAGSATQASPVWADIMRSAGFEEVSNQGSPTTPTGSAVVKAPRMYGGFTGFSGAGTGAALRHGETVTASYATSGGPIVGTLIGDVYANDALACIDETSGTAGTGAITLTGGTSGKVTNAGTIARDTTVVVAFRLLSDINRQETLDCDIYTDGKRLRLKGCMSNAEMLFDHGDVLKTRFTIKGVVNGGAAGYGDFAIPTSNVNDSHYIPPVFLGKDVRVSTIDGSKVYGKATGSATIGAFNKMSINTGNDIIMRENSLDPAGVDYARITKRKPSGSFNPDEVLSASEFDFMTNFIAGNPLRLKIFMGLFPSSAVLNDGNTVDVIAPGIVFSGLADVERDNINVWDASFDLTGGDYDTSAAGELPGNDNELTLIYR